METLRLAIGRVATELEAHQLLSGPALAELDRFPVKGVICPQNEDGSFDVAMEVTVGNDLERAHFQIAHLALLFVQLNNRTLGKNVPLLEVEDEE